MPSKEILEDLLFTKGYSKKRICTILAVGKPVLSRWMKYYNLTGLITPEMQKIKREKTIAMKSRALEGETIEEPGFNSEFLEEYYMEQQIRESQREENFYKRLEEEKIRRENRRKKKSSRIEK